MQMQLPIFPANTKLVNATLGIKKEDGMVYYLHNGSPIFCHVESNINHYRFICGNLVGTKLCRASELADTLGVTRRSIERYAKRYREGNGDTYFNPKERRGQCFKMTPEILIKTQELLDKGLSKEEISRRLGISSSSIRNHLKKGTLKKNHRQRLAKNN
ncbi:MAG: hypothetical protein GY870_13130 [archaeon]|nr:hypothetical protein [archaeon]